jgi:hypothetical protein
LHLRVNVLGDLLTTSRVSVVVQEDTMLRVVFFVFCLSFISLFFACSRKPNDDVIGRDIETKVSADPQTQDSQVAVESKQGKVKLTGKAKTQAARQQVEKIAKAEPGVSIVDDETTVAPPAPQAALPPPPTFSAAQKINMFVYPKNNQNRDQQLRDELDCYNLSQRQSGVNPEAPPPAAPTSADVAAAQQAAASGAQQAQGGRVRGAAGGAAGGAMIGAIAGDTGKGAAIGAVAGTMRGGMKQRQTNAAMKQQAAQQGGSQVQQDYAQAKASYDQGMNTFKRAFSACMDARAYSVK